MRPSQRKMAAAVMDTPDTTTNQPAKSGSVSKTAPFGAVFFVPQFRGPGRSNPILTISLCNTPHCVGMARIVAVSETINTG